MLLLLLYRGLCAFHILSILRQAELDFPRTMSSRVTSWITTFCSHNSAKIFIVFGAINGTVDLLLGCVVGVVCQIHTFL